MAYDNVALLHRWFEEVWNKGNADAIDEMLAPQTIAHGMGPNGTDLHGIEGFKAAQALFRGAFPDLHITVKTVVAEGDKVAAHFVCKATHQGDNLGVPATGKSVLFSGMTIARYHEGRIVEGWNVIDLLSALQQAGSLAALAPLP